MSGFWDLFTNSYRTLAGWQWLLLLAVPPLIVLLYFLKLKRRPLEVPSTFLWQRTIEDMHVNSLWQRLRQNLLLLLQLLVILFAILALLRPSWQGSQLTEERYIFLVDTSASMGATDVQPTRLDSVKQRLIELVDQQLKPGSVAMVISFSDRPKVEQPFTDNRNLLKRRIREIRQTQRTSELDEALRLAAGLANPGRIAASETDVAAADALPATLMIFSDGRYRAAPQFAMGNLTPIYVPIGAENAQNVGIVAFDAMIHPERPESLSIFGRLQNFGDQAVTMTANLVLYNPNRNLLDAVQVKLEPGGSGGVDFTIDTFDHGELRLELENPDALAVDNTAFAAVNPRGRAKVLLVTSKNDALETALATSFAKKLADVRTVDPSHLQTEEYQRAASDGSLDLVIFDQCQPKTMPLTNTLFIGAVPADGRWSADELQSLPQIIDADRAHPLMRFVELGDIKWIVQARPLKLPPGGNSLIESHLGVLAGIAAREGFEDLVLAFAIVGSEANGERFANTDWPIRVSFPVFIGNILTYLGGGRIEAAQANAQPGQPVTLRTTTPVDKLRVQSPRGEVAEIARGAGNVFIFGGTDDPGIYQVRPTSAKESQQRFAVNLFDEVESNIRPQLTLQTKYDDIEGKGVWEAKRREGWKYLLLGALALLMVEWYVYNKRVYI
jgi:hypothetical protein